MSDSSLPSSRLKLIKLLIMSALCCCFRITDPEDVSTGQNRIRANGIIHTLLSKYRAILHNEHSDASTSAASLRSDAASDNIQPNFVTSAPRILHMDAGATISCQHQDGQIKGQENDQVGMEHGGEGDESSGLQCEGSSTAPCSEFQLKFSSEKSEFEAEAACVSELSEEEDVCPTCLDEYIPENPRIVLQCSHSYHLSCIYEWMERSENCPICGKTMVFAEAT